MGGGTLLKRRQFIIFVFFIVTELTYSPYHATLVIMSIHSFLSRVQTIISDRFCSVACLYNRLPVRPSVFPSVCQACEPVRLSVWFLSLPLSVSLCVRSPICPYACRSVRPPVFLFFHPFVCLSIRPSVCPSACTSVCSCVSPSIRPSCLFVRPSAYRSVYQPICSSVCQTVCLSILLSISPSVRLPASPSVPTDRRTDGRTGW